MLLENNQTLEEHQESLRRLAEMVPMYEEKIRGTNQKIRALFTKCSAIDLLAHLSLDATPLPTASLESIYSPDVDAFDVEHLAHLAFQDTSCQDIPMVDDALLDEARQLLGELKQHVINLGMARVASRIDPLDELTVEWEMLRGLALEYDLFVRGRAYPWDYKTVIEGLFKPFARQLEEQLCFSIDDVLTVLDSLPSIVHQKLKERRASVKPFENEVRAAVSALAKGEEPRASEEALVLAKHLKELPKREQGIMLNHCVARLVFCKLSQTVLCGPQDIAAFTSITISKVEAILNHLSLSLGKVPKEYAIPTPTDPLRKYPIVAHKGKYFAPSIGLLLPSVQPLFERTIRSSNAHTWERYHKARHNYVLETSLDIFERLLPCSLRYRELNYFPKDAESNAELDGLIISGSIAFLIEVKAGGFSDAARNGFNHRLSRDLKELVGKAHEQALRALKYIESQEEVQFTTEKGKTVAVKKSELTSVYLVTITLEPMGHLTSGINSASRFPFLKGDMSRLPWMVSIHDLLAIAEILDAPFIFPHYIRARVTLGAEGIAEAFDELDFVGEYLQSGLSMTGQGVRVQIGTATHEIDQYLYQKYKMRPGRPKKPKMTMAPGLELFFKRLFKSSSRDRVECAFAILDMEMDVQRELLKHIHRVVRKAKKDGRTHNVTHVYATDKGWGFTFICTQKNVVDVMLRYAQDKRIEHGVRKWLIVGSAAAKPNEFFALAVH